MSANTHTTETTTERKPPTIADIVREKTGDGALIIDFFTDVMTGRIEGAELCHRIDAAKAARKVRVQRTPPSSSPSTKASPAVTPSMDDPTPPTPAPPRRGASWP